MRQQTTRRQLFSILPTGLAACAGCAAQMPPPAPENGPGAKSGMTWEAVFRFAYQNNYIPAMKSLQKQIGKERFIRMLQQGVAEAAVVEMAKNPPPNRDFATWVSGMRTALVQNALTYTVIEDSPKALEVRVTECLWARIFREEGAADIGYAGICHPDFAAASAFNPKIKLVRSKTLMQGRDCCDLRYTVES
jgi:hypothetical protein